MLPISINKLISMIGISTKIAINIRNKIKVYVESLV